MRKGGRNPWLRIPVSDYEGHMGHPAVQQLPYLSAVFQEVLRESQPNDIAVLGCSTGNGFEHIPSSTKKIIGIDVNQQYLEVVRQRYGDRLPGLELICADLLDCAIAAHSMDLVHGALIFEYVDPAPVMERIATWLRAGGVFSVVLQLPSAEGSPVTETPYESLRSLQPIMKLVSPELIAELAIRHDFKQLRTRVDTLPTGKKFHVGLFALARRQAIGSEFRASCRGL